jgi:protoporphyrinogen IX oxidase
MRLLRGQRTTRSEKRGGFKIPRRAAPRQMRLLRGQRTTRSEKRGGYTSFMLWIKSLHIVFVASWFAGLFYLPRIFVNLAMVAPDSVAERERLLLMARKLLRFSHMLVVLALGFGLWLWSLYGFAFGMGNGQGMGWMHVKLLLVLLAVVYHGACARMLLQFEAGTEQHSHVWFRWFNEAPVLLLLGTVILVVVKPF